MSFPNADDAHSGDHVIDQINEILDSFYFDEVEEGEWIQFEVSTAENERDTGLWQRPPWDLSPEEEDGDLYDLYSDSGSSESSPQPSPVRGRTVARPVLQVDTRQVHDHHHKPKKAHVVRYKSYSPVSKHHTDTEGKLSYSTGKVQERSNYNSTEAARS